MKLNFEKTSISLLPEEERGKKGSTFQADHDECTHREGMLAEGESGQCARGHRTQRLGPRRGPEGGWRPG